MLLILFLSAYFQSQSFRYFFSPRTSSPHDSRRRFTDNFFWSIASCRKFSDALSDRLLPGQNLPICLYRFSVTIWIKIVDGIWFYFTHKQHVLLVADKAIGPEANAVERKIIFTVREQDAGHHNIKIGNKSFESVKQLKYLVKTTTTNKTGNVVQRNTEARFRYRCSRGKVVSITYFLCVCVCNLTYPEFKAHAPYSHLRSLSYFYTLFHKQKNFRKTRNIFFYFSTTLKQF